MKNLHVVQIISVKTEDKTNGIIGLLFPTGQVKRFVCHLDNDRPSVFCLNGTNHWYKHGKCHRDKGEPATISPIGKEWWKNGRLIKWRLI